MDLTRYSPNGGCNCKLPQSDLDDMLTDVRAAGLKGAPDDAAVYDLGEGQVLLSSVDFGPPVVDSAIIAGEIAAKHAMSDVLACGVAPTEMDAIIVLPPSGDKVEIGRDFMLGFAEAAREAGCDIVGGHTIEGVQPLVGAAVRAVGPRRRLKLKSAARPGDLVAITKPIGAGAVMAGARFGVVSEAAAARAVAGMRRLNREGERFGRFAEVHAMTDITGFGVFGHALEVAEASDVAIELSWPAVPKLDGALRAIAEGFAPALAAQTLCGTGALVDCDLSEEERLLLADPQTNGGLLLTLDPDAAVRLAAEAAAVGGAFHVIGVVKAAGATRSPLTITRMELRL